MGGTVLATPLAPAMTDGLDLAMVYRQHHDLVWRSLRALGVDAGMTDDATQDVFMVVHRRLHDYDGQTPLRRWVLGITRNVAAKYRQRSASSASRLRALPDEADGRAPAPLAVVDTSAEDALARREAAAVVERFVESLDEDKRAVFVLCEVEGLTAPEASEVLGVKLNTIYSRLRVARGKFEQAIARHRAAGRRRVGAR